MNSEPSISDPRERIKCACPRDDAYECIRVRYGRDLLFDDDPDPRGDDEPCECACHYDGDHDNFDYDDEDRV